MPFYHPSSAVAHLLGKQLHLTWCVVVSITENALIKNCDYNELQITYGRILK